MPRFNNDRRNNRNSDRREQKQMYDTVCDDCGKNCKVPFRPTSGKPIYCSNCFEYHNDRRENSFGRSDNQSRGNSWNRRDGNRMDNNHNGMHKAICDECGDDCEVPFKPTSSKPIFCSICFENRGNSRDHRIDANPRAESKSSSELMHLMTELNAKFDRLLDVLGQGPVTMRFPKESDEAHCDDCCCESEDMISDKVTKKKKKAVVKSKAKKSKKKSAKKTKTKKTKTKKK